MKGFIFSGYVLLFLTGNGYSMEFDGSPPNVQTYIIQKLRLAAGSSEISVLHDRADETVRLEDGSMPHKLCRVLGLQKIRLLSTLKGNITFTTNDIIYIYQAIEVDNLVNFFRSGRGKQYPLYNPLFFGDNLVRLSFVVHQAEPLKKFLELQTRINPSRLDQIMQSDIADFVQDRMTAQTFMEKYSLTTVFSNKVYRIAEGCTFQIDYPVPRMEATDFEKYNPHVSFEENAKRMQKESGLIHLSAREASEVVFIAHLQDGEDGIAKYNAMAKGDPLLVPIDKPDFQTDLGRRLYGVMTGNPDEKDKPHDEAHGHHHPVMSDAERAAWQPPPNLNTNGNVWSYLMPDKMVKTIEFFTDKEVRVSTNGRVSEIFQWFKEKGEVAANGSRWFPSPDGKTILEETRQRTWHRGLLPPAPEPDIAKTLSADGTRWEIEEDKTFHVFRSDGTFAEEGKRWMPKSAWKPWYGRTILIQLPGRNVEPVFIRLSPDGNTLTQENGKVYQRRMAKE